MKKAPTVALAIAGALSLAACQTSQQTGTSFVGAGAGALVTTGTSAATLAGIAVGGVARGSMTDALAPAAPRPCKQWGHNSDGNRICVLFS